MRIGGLSWSKNNLDVKTGNFEIFQKMHYAFVKQHTNESRKWQTHAELL